MNGGKIEISIAAVYGQFEQDMKKAAETASAGGKQAGQKFGEGFSAGSTTYIDRTINDIRGKLTKVVSAFTIVSAFSAALEEGAKGANLADSIAAGLKSLPVVGTFVSIGENLGKIIMQTAAKEAANEELVQTQARLNQVNQDRIDRQRKAQEDAARRAEAAAKRQDEINRSMDAQIDARDKARHDRTMLMLEEQGDKRKMISEEFFRKEVEIHDRLRKDLAASRSEDESFEIQRRYEAELDLAKSVKDYKLREAASAAMEEAERRSAVEKRETERRAEMIAKAEKDARDEISRLESQGVAAQSMVGTISTSLGTYKFAGYTDNEKKQNDGAIRRGIEAVRENTRKMVEEIRSSRTAGGFA